MNGVEVNFDGLIGPSHNYAGLSLGNIASSSNALSVSYPKMAAQQGLQKMRYITELGLPQGILLPQQRPHLPTLRSLGYLGSDRRIIEQAANASPEILAACYSASCMWTANAATVSPSADSADGKVHFTAANLSSMFHRSIEHQTTSALLARIFDKDDVFSHHRAISSNNHFGDEGAANHNRFAADYASSGVQLFVFGRYALRKNANASSAFPSRQTYEASAAIARLHRLDPDKVVFAQQNPNIIDAGAFHNDVVSVSNLNTFFMHEEAFVDKGAMQAELQAKFGEQKLHFIEVPSAQVSVKDAIKSYLFNSQLIRLPGEHGMVLVLPRESQENQAVNAYLESLLEMDTPIKQIKFVDVRQSMQNGGGPACLRLRVALTEQESAAVNPKFLLNDGLFATLNDWIERHYRDQIHPDDLADPLLMDENFAALDELTQLFGLGAFYPFQKA